MLGVQDLPFWGGIWGLIMIDAQTLNPVITTLREDFLRLRGLRFRVQGLGFRVEG